MDNNNGVPEDGTNNEEQMVKKLPEACEAAARAWLKARSETIAFADGKVRAPGMWFSWMDEYHHFANKEDFAAASFADALLAEKEKEHPSDGEWGLEVYEKCVGDFTIVALWICDNDAKELHSGLDGLGQAQRPPLRIWLYEPQDTVVAQLYLAVDRWSWSKMPPLRESTHEPGDGYDF